MRNQRQIKRLESGNPGLVESAIAQLKSSIVFHFDAAIAYWWHYMVHTFTLKCGVCGEGHLKTLKRESYNYSSVCVYGWHRNFAAMVKGTIYHLFHGMD